jgi:hypothetical protein
MEFAENLSSLRLKPIQLEDKKYIQPFLDAWDIKNSELSFVSLIIWGSSGAYKYDIVNDFLFIKLRRPNVGPYFFAPIPRYKDMDYSKALAIARAYSNMDGREPTFACVASPMLELFKQAAPECIITPDRNNFDYIYTSDALINLPGKKYHSKRNHINKLNSLYSYTYERITPASYDECMEVYEKWAKKKDPRQFGILPELSAVKTALKNMDELGLIGGCIRIDGYIEAFTVGERTRNDMAIIHIEKANDEIEGLFTLINQQFAEHELSACTYINREEDMGLEGLRRAKLSYRPEFMLEKHLIHLAK